MLRTSGLHRRVLLIRRLRPFLNLSTTSSTGPTDASDPTDRPFRFNRLPNTGIDAVEYHGPRGKVRIDKDVDLENEFDWQEFERKLGIGVGEDGEQDNEREDEELEALFEQGKSFEWHFDPETGESEVSLMEAPWKTDDEVGERADVDAVDDVGKDKKDHVIKDKEDMVDKLVEKIKRRGERRREASHHRNTRREKVLFLRQGSREKAGRILTPLTVFASRGSGTRCISRAEMRVARLQYAIEQIAFDFWESGSGPHNAPVSVEQVYLSRNIQDVTITWSADIETSKEPLLKKFVKAQTKRLRALIARRLNTKYVPRVHMERVYPICTSAGGSRKPHTSSEPELARFQLESIFEQIKREREDGGEDDDSRATEAV